MSNDQFVLTFDKNFNMDVLEKVNQDGDFKEVNLEQKYIDAFAKEQKELKIMAQQIFKLNKEFSLLQKTFENLKPEDLVKFGLDCTKEEDLHLGKYDGKDPRYDALLYKYTLERKFLVHKDVGIVRFSKEIKDTESKDEEAYINLEFSNAFKEKSVEQQIEELQKLNKVLLSVENIVKLQEQQKEEIVKRSEQEDKIKQTTAVKQTFSGSKPK